MLIPSIDLRGGRVVQLVQGRRLALSFDDVFAWVERFAGFPRVQVIDLDGALGTGANDDLVRAMCARLPCRIGGGIRDAARARMWLDAGAAEVIVGSSLFTADGVNEAAAAAFADAAGVDRLIGAVDSAGGRVVVRGWRESTTLTAEAAARALEPYCGGFLYTHVDTEGLMGGIDMDAVRRVRAATGRPMSAAGGITTDADVAALDAIDVDAVVGMAIYTGRLQIRAPGGASRPPAGESVS
jgi:phosphoribosylformimino-5-aminoimidazole carboxamide ribotide isomerase